MNKLKYIMLLSLILSGCGSNVSSSTNSNQNYSTSKISSVEVSDSSVVSSSFDSSSNIISSSSEDVVSKDWTIDEYELFYGYFLTDNIPFIDFDEYVVTDERYEYDSTVYVMADYCSSDKITAYENKLVKAGYEFYRTDENDGSSYYAYYVKELNLHLIANAYISRAENFCLSLKLDRVIPPYNKEGNWSKEDEKIFENAFGTTNIPFIGGDGYVINEDFSLEYNEIFVTSSSLGDSNVIIWYSSQLEKAGYSFIEMNPKDNTPKYGIQLSEGIALVINPYLSMNGNFMLHLKLENLYVLPPFVETGAWKEEDIAMFEEYLGYSDIPYGGYGQYMVIDRDFEIAGCISIVYNVMEDMSYDYAQKLYAAGARYEDSVGGYFFIDVNEEFSIKISINFWEVFYIDLYRVNATKEGTSFPSSEVDNFLKEVRGETEYKVPALEGADRYEYTYDNIDYVGYLGRNIDVICYSDNARELLVNYYNLLLELGYDVTGTPEEEGYYGIFVTDPNYEINFAFRYYTDSNYTPLGVRVIVYENYI